VRFAKGIDPTEAAWLAETINTCLDSMAPHRAALVDWPLAQDSSADTDVLVFQPSRDRCLQPSDSRWKLQRDRRSLDFTCRGRWSLAAIAMLMFLNLFWNGIVGVFIVQLVKDFEWFLALFLLPFEAIGLGLLMGLLYACTAPLWGVTYCLQFGHLERRLWGPLYGSTRTWAFDELDHVEISRPGFDHNLVEIPPKRFGTGDYRLRLLDVADRRRGTIDGLTRGESLWIADTVMNELPQMFRRS
jgi:hypothetical protein